jgi:hypothetical protein
MSHCMSLTTARTLVYHATVSCTTCQRRLSVMGSGERRLRIKSDAGGACLGLAVNGVRGEEGIA